MSKFTHLLLFSILITLALSHRCHHDQFNHNHTKIFLNDLTDQRLLQNDQNGRIRIYVDYSQLSQGGLTQVNTIKRIMNITASYFYILLNVTRLPRLFYPANQTLQCGGLNVPESYVKQGVIGDVGLICGNQNKKQAVYIARSLSCVHLNSTKRPIWGAVIFNNFYLKFDQAGFQQILFVGMHQFTHVLGFSASMYQMYPKGNPLIKDPSGTYYLNSTDIQRQIAAHFKCNNSKGLPLEDQDGTLIASHWQRKVLGNQFIVATNRKNSFVSRFTLALLNSTGWYNSVNYSLAEPITWGAGQGCKFLDIDNCDSNQFCSQSKVFSCDADGTGIARCDVDAYTGSCMVPKYFVNTICIDENYEIKNLNAKLNALQRGGSTSRCFDSDFRQIGTQKNVVNNRCYVSICSASGQNIFILIGSYILVCRKQGQVITAPVGLEGSLTCPKKFANYCQSKKTCPYHCNKNGACIDGKCLCTGRTFLSSSCADVSIMIAPIGTTGGLFNAFQSNDTTAQLTLPGMQIIKPAVNIAKPKKQQIKTYSIDSKCIQGTTFDKLFGECLKCREVFSCDNCDETGCLVCDDASPPRNGVCQGP